MNLRNRFAAHFFVNSTKVSLSGPSSGSTGFKTLSTFKLPGFRLYLEISENKAFTIHLVSSSLIRISNDSLPSMYKSNISVVEPKLSDLTRDLYSANLL
ncbi:hypothetical protein OGAPHI_005435 [Ogataea philodendri]|uniref:Uncharacterized protein n=1 Tax=Ogataea philodendri TaxID=1378263 RepID=A0A9P8NZQ0_9ASCO|nr:uncharacterized protein OGAPHI_005435 [Ogataea philodendri]KAH3662187.1 hypothetical protein OGAPHI_005435 [Ogataea philodendri]